MLMASIEALIQWNPLDKSCDGASLMWTPLLQTPVSPPRRHLRIKDAHQVDLVLGEAGPAVCGHWELVPEFVEKVVAALA